MPRTLTLLFVLGLSVPVAGAAPPETSPEVKRHDLRLALEEVIAGKPVSVAVTPSVGCPIVREPASKPATTNVSYHRDVAPILQKSCQGCHRPGEVGPFALMNY